VDKFAKTFYKQANDIQDDSKVPSNYIEEVSLTGNQLKEELDQRRALF
jgi:hypothetical protein